MRIPKEWIPTNTQAVVSRHHTPLCHFCEKKCDAGASYIRVFSYAQSELEPKSDGVTRIHIECSRSVHYAFNGNRLIGYARMNAQKGNVKISDDHQ